MKRSAQLASLRSLSGMGLPAEQYIPALLESLHGIIPSLRNLFDWTDARGNLVRYYFEGPIDHEIAGHYFAEFHNRREADAMPTFQQVVNGRSVIRSADELDTTPFFRSALYNEIWRPQGLHYRLEAVVKGVQGQPLGSLVLYRGPGERRFDREDESLLSQVVRYVARALEAPSAGLTAGEVSPRPGRRAVLCIDGQGALQHMSADALQVLLMSHGDVTPDSAGRPPRREDFPTLTLLWQHHQRAVGPQQNALTLTVENAWGRFAFESTAMAPLGAGQGTLLHVNIVQYESRSISLRRAIESLPLTAAQREVCALLNAGHSNGQIAQTLSIAPSTVNDHVKKIYARLEVHSVHELLALVNQRMAHVPG